MTESTVTLVCKRRKELRGKDHVTILCGENVRVFETWNQGGIPHEMVHYVVEATFGMRGFVRLIGEGETSEEILEGTVLPSALVAEALTNAYQYEMWGMAEHTNEELRANTMQFGGLEELEFGDDELDRGRVLLVDLIARWQALGPAGKLELALPLAPTAVD